MLKTLKINSLNSVSNSLKRSSVYDLVTRVNVSFVCLQFKPSHNLRTCEASKRLFSNLWVTSRIRRQFYGNKNTINFSHIL